jgi:hypothetical protein
MLMLHLPNITAKHKRFASQENLVLESNHIFCYSLIRIHVQISSTQREERLREM